MQTNLEREISALRAHLYTERGMIMAGAGITALFTMGIIHLHGFSHDWSQLRAPYMHETVREVARKFAEVNITAYSGAAGSFIGGALTRQFIIWDRKSI